jgi:hypothetical protein
MEVNEKCQTETEQALKAKVQRLDARWGIAKGLSQ